MARAGLKNLVALVYFLMAVNFVFPLKFPVNLFPQSTLFFGLLICCDHQAGRSSV